MSSSTLDDQLPSPQRRIRHITSLQVRNLTPFPARDALAQTLTQPGPSSSSLPPQPADDIELTVASRRRRRISTGSVATMLTHDAEEEGLGGSGAMGTRRQTRSGSRGSFQSLRNMGTASATSTIRPRPRTSSKASSLHLQTSSSFSENADPDSPTEQDGFSGGGHFVTYSQRALEKIVSSRLVETFVTLTSQPPPTSHPPSRPTSPLASPSPATIVSRKGKDVSVKRAISASAANHRRGASSSSLTSTLSTSSSHINRSQSSMSSSSPVSSRVRTTGSVRSSSSFSRATNFPSPPPTPPPGSPRLKPIPSTSTPRPPAASDRHRENGQAESSPSVPTPFYISPIHLPSTNPTFSHLDPEREFAPWADTSGSRVKVTAWGRGNIESSHRAAQKGKDVKGKAKEMLSSDSGTLSEDGPSWRVLEEWVVDLDDMESLPPDFTAHHLPSNTLLLTLSSGQVFKIPPVSSSSPSFAPSRVPSPVGPEYNSDGEINDHRRRQLQRAANDAQRRERATLEKSLRETRMKKGMTWHDLVKIVNLHTCIIDTQESLDQVVRNCNALLESDGFFASLRECSEREEWIETLRAERKQVLQGSVEVKDVIEARRKDLNLRRHTLAAARAIHDKDFLEFATHAQEVASEQQRHSTLVSSLPPLRTALIQTVTFIFPIEPLSAPDLLFTILGSPLPIPISSDPAPPLSLPSHPEVTDDTTATALGYVAQVVQLVSAYLGKGLVYPVTCCGSRSVIKDPISAMMGPRMFPLYSKGVETYRFEYGVFLLNKDIEILMMDRNLHVMDMRHTLPNLKNLLLTLTTGEDIKQAWRLASPLSVAIPLSTRSSNRAISPLALDAQAEAISQKSAKPAVDIAPRKPFLSPLAAILRARYPSSVGRPTVKVVDETPEPALEGDGGTEVAFEQSSNASTDNSSALDQEEAKSTLKPNGVPPTPSSANENGRPFEKADEPPIPPPSLPGVT